MLKYNTLGIEFTETGKNFEIWPYAYNFPKKSIFSVIAYGQKISSRTRTVKNFQRVRVHVRQKSPRTPRTRARARTRTHHW